MEFETVLGVQSGAKNILRILYILYVREESGKVWKFCLSFLPMHHVRTSRHIQLSSQGIKPFVDNMMTNP